jgi:hypothetical protein
MICIILGFVKTEEGKNKVLDDEISMEIKTMKPNNQIGQTLRLLLLLMQRRMNTSQILILLTLETTWRP